MTGWECPKCGNVYAPWVSDCSYCKTTNTPDPPPMFQGDTCYICKREAHPGMMCDGAQIT